MKIKISGVTYTIFRMKKNHCIYPGTLVIFYYFNIDIHWIETSLKMIIFKMKSLLTRQECRADDSYALPPCVVVFKIKLQVISVIINTSGVTKGFAVTKCPGLGLGVPALESMDARELALVIHEAGYQCFFFSRNIG